MLQIIFAGAFDLDKIVPFTAAGRYRYFFFAGQVATGQTIIVFNNFVIGARKNQLAAMCARSRTNINDMIGCLHDLFFVLYNQYRITYIA